MTPFENEYFDMEIDKRLMELVKIECAMKKHFVYIDNIDELKHNDTVIRDFDHSIKNVRTLINKLSNFRKNLI